MLSHPSLFFFLKHNNSFARTVTMAGGLMGAIAVLKKTFDKYAGSDGEKGTLSKKELAAMLKAELPGAEGANKEEADKFFKMLDGDGDGVVDFNEYVVFVATLTMLLSA